jgi:glycine cleavage system H protein
MNTGKPKTLHYKRSHFATQLPVDYLYSPSHAWLAREEGDLWRVGITKFASRMLGEMVDCGFEIPPDSPVQRGQVIGWLEGFKAISDIFCVVDGNFAGSNPVLKEKMAVINKDCYGAGWIYRASGQADPRCLDATAYRQLLDKTIDRMLEKAKGDSIK